MRNLHKIVYDVECLPNIFTVVAYNTVNRQTVEFELSSRKNNLLELQQYFLSRDVCFVGYNNHHYDDILINKLLTTTHHNHYNAILDLYELSKCIIDETDYDKRLKYNKQFNSIDLLKLMFSGKLRVSLKELEVTMEFRNVREFNHPFDKPLNEARYDELLSYNKTDVLATSLLLDRLSRDLSLRYDIDDEYNIDTTSMDGVTLGMEILKQEYLRKSGLSWDDIKELRSPEIPQKLRDTILPKISFRRKELKTMFDLIKKSDTYDKKGKAFNYKFLMEGVMYSVGVGGIHSINRPEIVIPNDDELLLDVDVASLYPSLIEIYKFYPEHLGEQFLETYSEIKTKRLKAKHEGNKTVNETLKLALNGLSGHLQNKHSWCYSPKAAIQLRMNGQLLLLMLTERIIDETTATIIQINTDGIFLKIKKTEYAKFQEICKRWETFTELILEETRFEGLYQLAVNDYFAIGAGFAETKNPKLIKTKGCFIQTPILGKGLKPKIIPEAVIKHFTENIPAQNTIKACTDIKKFVQYERTGKQWNVVQANIPQQRTNRIYVCNKGNPLYKWKWTDDGKRQYNTMIADANIGIVNKLPNAVFVSTEAFAKYFDVDYRYYIKEAYKIIDSLQPRETSLF